MMPGAWAPHAATLFNEHPTIDIGVHLTLTSEWDAVKWRPLTQAPSLTDENGYFRPLLTPRPGDGRSALTDIDWSLEEIAAEFRAQISAAVAMFAQVSHVSAHMCRHFRDIDPRLGAISTISTAPARRGCARAGVCGRPGEPVAGYAYRH